jgi:hypothetical protein
MDPAQLLCRQTIVSTSGHRLHSVHVRLIWNPWTYDLCTSWISTFIRVVSYIKNLFGCWTLLPFSKSSRSLNVQRERNIGDIWFPFNWISHCIYKKRIMGNRLQDEHLMMMLLIFHFVTNIEILTTIQNIPQTFKWDKQFGKRHSKFHIKTAHKYIKKAFKRYHLCYCDNSHAVW